MVKNMRYHILTYGCQMNEADSERIAAILRSQKHRPVEKIDEADLVVINACSVRQSAMHRVYDKINKYYKDKKIILAGCVTEEDRKKYKDKVYQIWHPDKYFRCKSAQERFSENSEIPREPVLSLCRSALVPIMTGCDNFCSYCVVPYTRGRERSRPADEILKEIKSLIKNGYKEILLLGQNVNSYSSPSLRGVRKTTKQSHDHTMGLPCSFHSLTMTQNTNFPRLLRLINALPGDFTIKFLSSHPKDMSDALIDTIAECEKVAKEIHLPIQSGDNTVLRKMNRKYTVGHYKKLIKKIRQKMPAATISTDVIVGFPSETKKQFENTAKLFKEIKFDKAYVSIYSPRPGTAAYKLQDDVPHAEKKRRWEILDKIANK